MPRSREKRTFWRYTRFAVPGLTLASVCCIAMVLVGVAAPGTAVATTTHRQVPSTLTGSLRGICPNPVQIVTDWLPEVDTGMYYQLAAGGGQVDTYSKAYTAPLINPFTHKKSGVDVELLSGGPARGSLQTPEILYADPDILLGTGDEDTAIAESTTLPVVGIFAPYVKSEQALMWNPKVLHLKGFSTMRKSGASVLYYTGTEFISGMEAAGFFSSSQLTAGYTGSPARFVADNGDLIEQVYATAEPYIYTHETSEWDKEVAYELVANSGYDWYSEMAQVTPANLKRYSGCFKRLVPMLQQAEANYFAKPGPTNSLIVKLNVDFKEIGGNYDAAVAAYATKTLLEDKIVSEPASGALGSLSTNQVAKLISTLKSILAKAGTPLPTGYSASESMTNRFIDPSIKFTSYHGPYNNTTGVIDVSGSG